MVVSGGQWGSLVNAINDQDRRLSVMVRGGDGLGWSLIMIRVGGCQWWSVVVVGNYQGIWVVFRGGKCILCYYQISRLALMMRRL